MTAGTENLDAVAEELRILLLEDVPSDAELEEAALLEAGLAFKLLRVTTRDAYVQALDDFNPDIVLADYRLPAYNGRDALEYARLTHPQIPVIIVSGTLGDEAAVELLKLGARDYVLKDHLAKLAPAIQRSLAEERAFQQRKLAEAALRESEEHLRKINRTLRTLSAGNLALVKATDEEKLLDDVCRIIVDIGEYRMAWVGYAADDPARSIAPMACQGITRDDLVGLQLTWADSPRGQGALAGALRSGQLQIRRDILKDSGFEFYHKLAVVHDWNANLAVPLADDGHVFGALSIFSADPNAFDADEVALLNELGSDLAFGINTLRTRAERDQAAERSRQYLNQIRTNLTDAIQAIATTIEMRDAYTAGHQRRVSELAAAIAREMGLPQEKIDGLHLAAVIHDLGKVSIPAEILSKPAKLSPIEFELIKVHPQSGHEILKGIDFPWPIAQIVLQHHERLDGSGYPQGLKREALLPEAGILAVADVVEAMASHRPYRAALGIDAALDEISRNRGRSYDPGAVDACLTLFREKGFAFSDAHGP